MKTDRLPAAALAAVLVGCTLMLLIMCCVISLWDSNLSIKTMFLNHTQMGIHIESGYVLYGMDAALPERLLKDSSIQLFEDVSSSRLKMGRKNWGLYEVVTVKSDRGRCRSVRLLGKSPAGASAELLYVADRGQCLSVAGRVEINGSMAVPGGALRYTQIRGDFFCGRKPDSGEIGGSLDSLFVPLRGGNTENEIAGDMERLGATPEIFRRSFSDPPVCLDTGSRLEGVDIRGQVVLCNPDSVVISRDCRLENVIVVAPVVRIDDGFRGSVQVFASDSVSLGKGVVLKSGSGVCVKSDHPYRCIRIGEQCELNGYVIVGKGAVPRDPVRPNYSQAPTAVVNGLVYVDGIADVHGTVNGCLLAGACYYFTPEGYYADMLYDLIINDLQKGGYPVFLDGPYERQVLKWLE